MCESADYFTDAYALGRLTVADYGLCADCVLLHVYVCAFDAISFSSIISRSRCADLGACCCYGQENHFGHHYTEEISSLAHRFRPTVSSGSAATEISYLPRCM